MTITLLTLLTTLLAVTYSASHPFLAEQNLICNTCVKVANHINSQTSTKQDALNECKSKLSGLSFTTLCAEILDLEDDITSKYINGKNANDICEELNFCDFEDETDYASMPAYDESIADKINELSTGWTAGKNKMFETATLQDVRKRLGTIVDKNYRYPIGREVSYTVEDYLALPENFDVREEWPECYKVSGTIRDQSDCGSCWTFGSTDAFNDRYCIATLEDDDEANTLMFSNEQVLGCCTEDNCGGSDGCDGGYPQAAWEYFVWNGVVSGGLYADNGKNDTCLPYSLPNCWHHEPDPFFEKCPDDEYDTPQCYLNCTNEDYPTKYNNDLHYASSTYFIEGNCTGGMENIMVDIYNYGSVSAAFLVYEDFEYYTCGVYRYTYGELLGGHSVKIMGWGVQDGTPYWLVANSWNQYWGDEGYFKILRGENECDIESEIYAGRVNDDDTYGFILTKEEKDYLDQDINIFRNYGDLLTDLGVCLAIGFVCAVIFMLFKKFDCKRKVERIYYNTFGQIEGEETHPLL